MKEEFLSRRSERREWKDQEEISVPEEIADLIGDAVDPGGEVSEADAVISKRSV